MGKIVSLTEMQQRQELQLRVVTLRQLFQVAGVPLDRMTVWALLKMTVELALLVKVSPVALAKAIVATIGGRLDVVAADEPEPDSEWLIH